MKIVYVVMTLLALYLISFSVFRTTHRSRLNMADNSISYRTTLIIDGWRGHAMKYLFYPALALDAHLTGRDTIFMLRSEWSKESLIYGNMDRC
jgi:hypothetical protein